MKAVLAVVFLLFILIFNSLSQAGTVYAATCSSLHGTCLPSGLCSGEGGTTKSATGCSSSRPVCCVLPPTSTPTRTPTPRPSCSSVGGTCFPTTGQCSGNGGTIRSGTTCSGSYPICCLLKPTATPTPRPSCSSLGGFCFPTDNLCAGEGGTIRSGTTCSGSNPVCCLLPPTSTPTPTPTPRPSCSSLGGVCFPSTGLCGGEGGTSRFGTTCSATNPICCVFPPTSTPTRTPTPTPNCSQRNGFCYTSGACTAEGGNNNGTLGCTGGNICCVVPTSTPTPTRSLPCVGWGGVCVTESGPQATIDRCSNVKWQVPDPDEANWFEYDPGWAGASSCQVDSVTCCKPIVPTIDPNACTGTRCWPVGINGVTCTVDAPYPGGNICTPLACNDPSIVADIQEDYINAGINPPPAIPVPVQINKSCGGDPTLRCCADPSGGGGGGSTTYALTGLVFDDTNHDGVQNGNEQGYTGANLILSGTASKTVKTIDSGNYFFIQLPNGTYTVNLAVPAGYEATTGTQRTGQTISNGNRTILPAFGITRLYSITGSVFNDANKDQVKDAGEGKIWSDNISITSTSITEGIDPGTVGVNQSSGAFTITGLQSGQYDISFSDLPTGFQNQHPKPSTFRVTVGPSCTFSPQHTNSAGRATCVLGDVTNLNFVITNSIPWFQTYGFDVRIETEGGMNNIIPPSPLYPAFMSIIDNLD